MHQNSLFDDIYIDSFAGGGGASTGIELATGHPVDIAINHDESAIMMHSMNHPFTEHYHEDVWKVDPKTVCRGRHVRLAWFSPDCKHFSRAKGAALVDRHIRGLAWVVLRWAGEVRPDIIMLENVPEFVTWGPVRKGKPIKRLAGTTYRRWHGQLEALGYEIGSRELCAADYGAPTTRKRFCLIARCDGEPIVWPERTHAPRESKEVREGRCLPWRSAADAIDWSIPAYSIFDTKEEIKKKHGATVVRPLRPNTLRRIAKGLDKFVIKAEKPFIVPSGDRVASLIQYHTEQREKVRGQGLEEPLMTIDGSNRYGLVEGYLTEYYGNGADGVDIMEPMRTVTSHDREGITTAHFVQYFGGEGHSVEEPMATINDKGQSVSDPIRTITATDGEFGTVMTKIVRADGMEYGHWAEIRELLNEFCEYRLKDDEVLLLLINDAYYVMCDICLRMLTPRELYRAMGFPEDYIIDHDNKGNKISRANQVARCGNAVCPALAEALVRANDDGYKHEIKTMEDLHQIMAY